MLKHGDTIGICAPSGSFDIHKFEKGLKVIRKMGFNPVVPDDIYQTKRYLAGNDHLRAEVITNFFADKAVKGIMCARGGFGAIRILDLLDWEIIQNNPKFFIGFSDITALLLNLARFPLMKVIHGPNITSLSNAGLKTRDSLYELLTIGSSKVSKLRVDAPVVINKGTCRGKLLGGNLATMNHLVGTIYQPEFRDCILFIEDTGEPPYKIDRMLTQMKMAGCFKGINGVVAGFFDKCENPAMIQEIIEEIFCEYKVPVLAGIESGHGKINLSLPLGVDAALVVEKSGVQFGFTNV